MINVTEAEEGRKHDSLIIPDNRSRTNQEPTQSQHDQRDIDVHPSTGPPTHPPASTCSSPKRGRQEDSSLGQVLAALGGPERSHETFSSGNKAEKKPQGHIQPQASSLSVSRVAFSSSLIRMASPEEPMQTDDPLAEIGRLRQQLKVRDQEISELKSHLDKFQSIFNFSGGSPPGILVTAATSAVSIKKRTRTRLFGISAEPGPVDSVSAGTRPSEVPKIFPKDDA